MANIAGIMELYSAYFNRAVDTAGVDYWANEMDTNGWTLDQVAQSFADQVEYTALYAGMTNAEIVTAVYTNVLNRDTDAAGATYWTDELTAGTMSVNNLVQAVVEAAKEDVDGLGDADVLTNKNAVSQHAYDNNMSEADAQATSLATITADAATVTAVTDSIDVAAAAAPGNTITILANDAVLTNAINTEGTPADTYLTTQSDTINALSFMTNATYIEDISAIDSDTLNATIGNSQLTTAVVGIENINVKSIHDAASLSFGSVEGESTVTVTGTKNFTAVDFDTAGDVKLNVNTTKTVTLEAGTATSDDVFDIAVTLDGGTITFGDGATDTGAFVDTVNLESAGTTANDITLTADINQYDGIDALNLTGAAALTISTPYVADMAIDTSAMTADVDMTLTGMDVNNASVDLGADITGTVKSITLDATASASEEANIVDASGVTGLESLNIGTHTDAGEDLKVTIDADVEVGIISSNGNGDDLAITVVDAADNDASALTLNVGGAAAITTGVVTAANIQNLTINSTGHEDGNSVKGFTTAALESLTIDASAVSMVEGEGAATYDTFTLATSGAADINAGSLTTGANINQIALSSEDAGDRTVTVGAVEGLKTDADDLSAGVDITGAGTGTVTVAGVGATLDTLRVDGSTYAGDTVVQIATTLNDVDADNFAGVNTIDVNVNSADKTISNLDASTVVKISETQNGIVIVTGSTTTRDILLAEGDITETGGTDAGTLTLATATTINIATQNTHATALANEWTLTLTDQSAANVINVDVADDADFVLDTAYTTFDASAGNREFTLNFTGDGDVNSAGVTSGADVDAITISANGEGTKEIGKVIIEAMADSAALNFTGTSDILVDEIEATATITGQSINLNGDGDATVTLLDMDITAAKTLTINSNSTDGTGENDIVNASEITFDAAAATLAITGNQDLIIGSTTDASMLTGNGIENIIDASAFTGDLELNIARAGDQGSDTHLITVGTANSDIILDSVATANEDLFNIALSEDGLTGDLVITKFSNDTQLDTIDFTNLTTDNEVSTTYTSGTGVLAFGNGAADETVTFAVSDYDLDGNNDLVGTSALFDGNVVIIGAADLALTDIAAANFI